MINFLKGTIVDISENQLVLEVASVGYELNVSSQTLAKLGEIGAKATVFTYLCVREDAITLFGFFSKHEKEMFLKLTSVSGVGPKLAVSVLSGITVDELASAIAGDNTARLSSIKGIGKKTAERIVLELKDKVSGTGFGGEQVSFSAPAEDAILALVGMGFSRSEAAAAVAGIRDIQKMSTEEIIISSLKGR